MMNNIKSKENIDFIECKRCDRNNWDEPDFWGCPRGCGMDCEAETKGTINTTKELKINKQ